MYSGTVRVPDRRIGTNFGNLKSKVLDRFWSKWPEGPSFSGSIWLVLPPIRLTPLEKKNWPALMYCRNWGLLHCIAPILNLNWYQKCEVSATAWGYCLRCYSQLSASVLSVKKRKEQQIQVTPRTACLTWFWIFSHQSTNFSQVTRTELVVLFRYGYAGFFPDFQKNQGFFP